MHAMVGDKRRMQIWKINASLLRIKDPEIKRKQWVADKPQTSSLKFIVLYCFGPLESFNYASFNFKNDIISGQITVHSLLCTIA